MSNLGKAAYAAMKGDSGDSKEGSPDSKGKEENYELEALAGRICQAGGDNAKYAEALKEFILAVKG